MKMIYLQKPISKTLSVEKYQFRYADQVSVGDEVLVDENDYLAPVEVISVSSIKMQSNHFTQTILKKLLLSNYPIGTNT